MQIPAFPSQKENSNLGSAQFFKKKNQGKELESDTAEKHGKR